MDSIRYRIEIGDNGIGRNADLGNGCGYTLEIWSQDGGSRRTRIVQLTGRFVDMGDGVLSATTENCNVGTQPWSRFEDIGNPRNPPDPGLGIGMVQPGPKRIVHDVAVRQRDPGPS
jgi:hypothetical protein